MDHIRNHVFLTSQNGRASVGTLYREALGELAIRHDSIYKIAWGRR